MKNNNYKAVKRLDYRAPDFTATDIELEFNLSDDYTIVKSTAHYIRLTEDKKAPLCLDGEDLELHSVFVDGLVCKYTEEKGQLIIEDVPDEFDVSIENVIAPALNTTLMGLYKSCGCFCTQCEPQGFRRITYFLDRPDVLAKYKVTIIGPESGCGVLLSNGNLVESGEKQGRRYCTWVDPFPKPSYLFALVAGSFDLVSDTFKTKSGREVSLQLYVDRGAYERGLWAMECIKQSMKWDEDRFNLEYDLDNFKVVAVDFFNQGAMENKSLNIFNSIYVLVDPKSATDTNFFNVQSVIGHEYFHNYTGDRVTLRDWFQLSLKESLTVFRDQEFSSDVASRALTRLHAVEVIRSAQFAEDASPMAHPVRPEEVMEMNNFYTVTIYDKGAEVIRMLHTIIGEDNFKKGLALYLDRYDGKAVTVDDFLSAMSEASAVDLTQFTRWYSQAGTPVVTAKWAYDANEKKLTLDLEQKTPPTLNQKEKDPVVIPIRTSFLTRDGKEVTPPELSANGIIMFTKDKESFTFTCDEEVLPVLFKDFSAPVKLDAPYSDDDYKLMLEYCEDPFIRKNSSEFLINNYVKAHLESADNLPVPASIIEAFSHVLSDKNGDPLLTCQVLNIPPLSVLTELCHKIDFDALHTIRSFIEKEIAKALFADFSNLYAKTKATGSYVYNIKEMSKRSLNHLALKMMIVKLKDDKDEDKAADLVRDHYKKSDNMTAKLCALTLAVHYDLLCKDELLKEFEDKWSGDPLVFDNFFRVQATAPSEDTVKIVRKLMKHPCFDKTNPNRVRALVGAMALSNRVALNAKDGSGYALLSEVVRDLDKVNPQVAARILTPLLSFKRFDEARAELARNELLRIKSEKDLSNGVFEKIEAALNS